MATHSKPPNGHRRAENGNRRADEETPLLREAPTCSPPTTDTTEEAVLPEAKALSPTRIWVTLISTWVGVFFGALDTTIVATLAGPISTSFNSLSLLSWLASAYLIANAACQPLSGRLTDIFSRRKGLVVSNIFFGVGTLICGLAGSQYVIIFGRVIAGMGGGGLMAICTFVGSDLVPLRKRGLVQGIGNVCFGAGAGLGGVFGGLINDRWGWRTAFLCQVPFIVISGILVWWTVNIPPKISSKSALSRIDFLGAFTLVLTLVLLLLGLNSGGNIVPWLHPLVLISLPLSIVSLLAFIYIESHIASEPIIPVKLLINPTVASACLANWFFTMVTYMILFYIPIFFQVSGGSTTSSGVRLIPQFLGTSAGSLGSGFIMNKTGKYKTLSVITMAFFVLGAGLLQTLQLGGKTWPVFIALTLTGIGYGGILTTTLLAVISAVSHDFQAVITSATYAFRSTGSTIGVTIASAIYQNLLLSGLHKRFDSYPGSAEEINKIRGSLDELRHLPEGWGEGVRSSYQEGLRGVFWLALGLSILGSAVGFVMKENVLHKNLERREEVQDNVNN